MSPGISPNKEENPGFAVFEVNETTLVPHSLKMTFMELEKTYGKTVAELPTDKMPLFSFEPSSLGLKDLTA